MIIALLRFNWLTLPNCAGFDLKTLSKHEKAKKSAKGRKYYTAREASTAARTGEHQFKEKAVSTLLLARRAELLAVASKGGLTLPGWRGRILTVQETALAMASKSAREASSSIVGIL